MSRLRLLSISCLAVAIWCCPASCLADPPREKPSLAALAESVKVATVAMHSEMGKPKVNLERFDDWCRKASEAGANFAVFPEECLTGSLNKSDLPRIESARIAAEASSLAAKKVPEICRQRRMTVVVGIVEPGENGKFRNNALVVGPTGQIVKYTKLWLPNRSEEAWFDAGRELPVITSQGWTFSVGICADIDRPEYFHAAFRQGADFMLLPIAGSGVGELVGPDGDQTKQANANKSMHMKFLPDRARETGMYLFYANQAGHSGTNWFPGLALAVGPDGKLVDEHLPTEGMIVTTVSRAAIANARRTRANKAASESEPLKNSMGRAVRVTVVREPN